MHIAKPAATMAAPSTWLKTYYFVRAAMAFAWVAVALVIGRSHPLASVVLITIYPALDAIANLVDARKNGGLARNKTQSINAAVSGLTTLAVLVASGHSMNAVLAVFGVWALLAGLLQLATGVRRWKTAGAQWAMILSGLQSAVAGTLFIWRANTAKVPTIADVIPYAAFGAFYFLVSASWLAVAGLRVRRARRVRSDSRLGCRGG